MNAIDKTLDERGRRYGAFTGHADVTQNLKRVMGQHPGWHDLKNDQREALEMVAHKIGRILNGDPNYIDSWHDIIGYVRLVEQRLEKEQAPAQEENATDPQSLGAAIGAPLKSRAFDANQAATFGPLPTGGLKQRIDRAIADLSRQKREADSKSIETCDCPGCTLERDIKAMFGNVEVEVIFVGEETGLTG
ncbi:hypothetical protein [Acidovorax sp. HMWF018]|uniref:hypothetical protein n=1 Tax=Acidovorax sp. HMWF018 TaxID=2056855 RepID=UPI0018EEBDF0|nr:hypothetical protein [Acidovorax sp. HMWF018]